MVERRSLHSSMRDSVAPHSSAMNSVCPENGRPESVTASLFTGAVTMASASPERHIPVAIRTYSTAATPQRASSRPNENSSIPASARASRSSAWSLIPVIRWAISRTAPSPTTIQRASGASSGSATACSTISGPIPAGSPMVKTIVGRLSMVASGIEKLRYLYQGVATPEPTGLGRDRDPVEHSAMENAARDSRDDLITQLDTLHSGRPADQRCRVSTGEHQGRGSHPRDPFTHLFHRDHAARNPQYHRLAAPQRVRNRFPRGGLAFEQHGGAFGQQCALLGKRHTVVRSDAEQRGAGSCGCRLWGALSAKTACQRRGQTRGSRPQNPPAHR